MNMDIFTESSKSASNIDRIPDNLVEELLCEYGPEGCYELSKKLIIAADKDMQDALNNNTNF